MLTLRYVEEHSVEKTAELTGWSKTMVKVQAWRARGIPADYVTKVYEGRPNPADLIVSGDVGLLINTPLGKLTQRDDYYIRRAALQHVALRRAAPRHAALCHAAAKLHVLSWVLRYISITFRRQYLL